MATRKKGGAKKTTRPYKRKETEPTSADVVIAANDTVSQDDVFENVMLLLDQVDATTRTRVISQVISTLAESKKAALEKAQKDFELFNQFMIPVTVDFTEPAEIAAEVTEVVETKPVSKYE